MKVYAVSAVSNFGVQNRIKKTSSRVLDFSPVKSSKHNELNFMANPLLSKYTSDFHGLTLLNQTNTLNRNSIKYENALSQIRSAGFERLFKSPKTAPLEKKNPVIWSVTSEFAPIKEGGLGSVPPEIKNNAEKLGVLVPTFIPMYLNEGKSSFLEKNGEQYYFSGNKEFKLQKIVSFKMDTFQDGKIQTIPIEIYSGSENNEGKPLIFVKADKYFDGTIYETSAKTEEAEKFAVFSKAVYEFAKLKIEGPRALRDVHIFSSNELDKIKEPDAMMLNDWQASPIAALMRYKAPMENANAQLSDISMEKLKNMTIATIGHNCTYQGSTQSNNNDSQRKEASNNILNTLFDKYTNDIVNNAYTYASSTNPLDRSLDNLDNSLVINYLNPWENSVNFLNMGVVLSDYFLPVSENYSQELIDSNKNELSGVVQWALIQKAKSGRLIGIINGNDYKNISLEMKLPQIKKTTGIDFYSYNQQSEKENVINSRLQNKYLLYSEYMRPATNSDEVDSKQLAKVGKLTSNIEFYESANGSKLPVIDKQRFDKTPVLSVVGRLVSQKGVDVAVDSIEKLFKNWEIDFPNQEKPIIYFAGMDNEGGIQRKKIEELINKKLSKEDSSRIVFAHGFVPVNAIMAGSDFFLMPSKFEPCGLTQSESMAVGTPVIASAVGGIVDTVNRNGKHTGILTDKNNKLTSDEFYEAIKKGLDIYFNNQEEYQNMVMDSISEDFSWIQKGKKGPVYDYLELFGIKRETLEDIK